MSKNKPENTVNPVIGLGISGSIAAYKSAELTSALVKAGIEVQAIMTKNAGRLVSPLTFTTLARNQTITSLWQQQKWEPQHIELAEKIDLLVIAPASADIIGKLARGIADDALSTLALAYEGQLLIAPAMNPRMWNHPALQDNIAILKQRGIRIIGPETGPVACGNLQSAGRMSEPDKIFNAVLSTLRWNAINPPKTNRKHILITAGPTREYLDPIRFLTNRSTGRMGYALAECALAAGHQVSLITGPTNLPSPAGARLTKIENAADMNKAVKSQFPDCDILIMAAAPADFKPRQRADEKIKKNQAFQDGDIMMKMEAVEDILTAVSKLKNNSQTVVGFAAETENKEKYAENKLHAKKLDWLVLNDVSRQDIGFAMKDNEVTLFSGNGQSEVIEKSDKFTIAAAILVRILND